MKNFDNNSKLFFNVLLTMHLSITSVNDQLYAQLYLILKYVYYSPLHVSSNVELIIRRSSCINITSGMVTLCKWPYQMLY